MADARRTLLQRIIGSRVMDVTTSLHNRGTIVFQMSAFSSNTLKYGGMRIARINRLFRLLVM